jgi:hypothetical protein
VRSQPAPACCYHDPMASGGRVAAALVAVIAATVAIAETRVDGANTPLSGPAACIGTWDGSAALKDEEPWTIAMVVASTNGARCGTIDYPSLGCGGDLLDCSVRKGHVHFRERYGRNPGTCVPAGTIEAQCQDRSMVWTWHGSGLVVRTTLKRRDVSR